MMAKIKLFLREAIMELKRVNWPSRAETIRLTLVVIGISLLLAVLLGLLVFIFVFFLNTFIIYFMNATERKEVKNPERHWYAVHTYVGYEDAVERYLKQRVASLSMGDKIFNVIVPKESKIKIKNGRRTEVEEKIYPGYVLVDMVLTEDSWYVVRNTPRVTGFVGPDSTKPTPLSRSEVELLLGRMGNEAQTFNVDLLVGEIVKIIDGPFKDYEGKIQEIDEEKGKVKVLVPIFGRDTSVELDSLQVAKI